ncbi:MAG: hypothetical protein KAJ75_04845 [Alphaproteobacteria bacterium]|nr:hypothetical protein [Alphaproteobacteria bacterium]
MSQAELADLENEVFQEEADSIASEQPEIEPANDNGEKEGVVIVATTLVSAVGNIACRRANVASLSDDETASLGEAMASVAMLYDFKMSEKAAAWTGLTMTAVAVVLPRLEQYKPKETPPTPPANENHAVELKNVA